jgi:hypothetical protein
LADSYWKSTLDFPPDGQPLVAGANSGVSGILNTTSFEEVDIHPSDTVQIAGW